jgi:hypothetical protein
MEACPSACMTSEATEMIQTECRIGSIHCKIMCVLFYRPLEVKFMDFFKTDPSDEESST